MSQLYDTIIIGGGPAGSAAAVYASRKKLKTLLITDSFGGQSVVSDKIENWIGEISISGFDLAQKLEKHVRAQEGIEVKTPEIVTKVEEIQEGLKVTTDQNNTYQAKTLIVCSGGRRKRLGIPGEDKFDGKGVSFCSTCDAPLFKEKTVAIVGSGNSGLEGVVDLIPYASKIYLLSRSKELKGDPATQEEVKKSEKVTVLYNAEAKEILGDQLVNGLKYLDKEKNEKKMIDVQGVFIEIGSVPNSEFIKDLVKTNQYNEVIIDHRTAQTSHSRIFAAGDITDEVYKQNNISVGDAVEAALSVYNYLLNIKKESPAASIDK